jgi:ActR/RegA family two-component response regulator
MIPQVHAPSPEKKQNPRRAAGRSARSEFGNSPFQPLGRAAQVNCAGRAWREFSRSSISKRGRVRMNVPWQIVIASADMEERRALCNILKKQGLEPIVASSVRECEEILVQENVGLIFCARSLADGDYRALLIAPRHASRKTRIVIVNRLTNWDEYLDAVRLGAFDVISAPCRPTDVEWMIIQALREEYAQRRQIALVQHGAGSFQGACIS